jgi:hypothetical protein
VDAAALRKLRAPRAICLAMSRWLSMISVLISASVDVHDSFHDSLMNREGAGRYRQFVEQQVNRHETESIRGAVHRNQLAGSEAFSASSTDHEADHLALRIENKSVPFLSERRR